MSQLHYMTLTALRNALAAGELTATEAVRACLRQIEATEPQVSAYLHLDAAGAMEQAAALDQAGPDPEKPLWGVPLSIKDVITVAGMPNTCGSKILENFVPFYDATCVAQAKTGRCDFSGQSEHGRIRHGLLH